MKRSFQDTGHQLIRFCVVGSVGFAIDGGLLYLLITRGSDPYLTRLFSFPIAVLATWWLNRVWTFAQASRARPAAQLGKYLMVQTTGALSNYATYALFLGITQPTHGNAMIGFTLGSVLGLAVNFSGARFFAFTRGASLE